MKIQFKYFVFMAIFVIGINVSYQYFVAVVKRSQNTKKASIVLTVCMKERCQDIDT